MNDYEHKVTMVLEKEYYCLMYFYQTFMVDIFGKNNKDENKYVFEVDEMKWDKKTETCELPDFKNGKPKKGKEMKTMSEYKLSGKTCGFVTYFEYKKQGKLDEAEFIIWYDSINNACLLAVTLAAFVGFIL
mmetsp:Transcript_2903/g.2730  ORF Transcript_2903/g.2730 Transcript_2903/m.2730 type:complete len:131 (-) Transcript_2903:9-401(-)